MLNKIGEISGITWSERVYCLIWECDWGMVMSFIVDISLGVFIGGGVDQVGVIELIHD